MHMLEVITLCPFNYFLQWSVLTGRSNRVTFMKITIWMDDKGLSWQVASAGASTWKSAHRQPAGSCAAPSAQVTLWSLEGFVGILWESEAWWITGKQRASIKDQGDILRRGFSGTTQGKASVATPGTRTAKTFSWAINCLSKDQKALLPFVNLLSGKVTAWFLPVIDTGMLLK